MSMDLSQIRKDLIAWIKGATTWKTIWDDQNAPRPDYPYMTLKMNSYVETGTPYHAPPNRDTVVITLDADLVTGNAINVTVNGVALSETIFATDHETTMDVIAGKIQAVTEVDTAVVSGSTNRTITVISGIDEDVEVDSFAISLGATQAGVTNVRGASAVVSKHNEFTLAIQSFGDVDSAQYLAEQEVINIRDSLDKEEVNQALNAAGLAFVNVLNLSDITGLFGTQREPRASLDLLFRINSTVTEGAGVIETVVGFP